MLEFLSGFCAGQKLDTISLLTQLDEHTWKVMVRFHLWWHAPGRGLLNIGYVSNETNTDVHMYTWRIYSSRCSHIAVQVEWDTEWNLHWFIYKCLNRLKNIWEWISDVLKWIGWESSWTILDTLAHIELQLYEKLSLWDQDVWNVILMFALCLAPYSVNW